MPLPFLTADREFGVSAELAEDAALPFEDRDSWRRPYRPGTWRVAAGALLLLLASYLLIAAVVSAAAGGTSGAVLGAGFAVAVILIALRLLRMGAWVSARGVRRVGFLRTQTVSWSAVTGIRTVQQPVRWLGLPRTVQGQAVLLVQQGDDRRAPLLTDHDADFLARPEAFERAADSLEAWGAEYAGH